MSYKYELGERLNNGLYELYRDGERTNAQIASLDLIKSNSVHITGGTFCDGAFHGGTFCGGDFFDGIFFGGTFRGGDFLGGAFHGGTFCGGDFFDGIFFGGTFRGGDFLGGAFFAGTFCDGTFCDGAFHGGDFHGGTFRGGDFYYGTFLGGTFHYGTFHDGTFHRGDFHETPLQISGSKHFLNYTEYKNGPSISIGCHTYSIKFWLENYEAIGKYEGYSDEQIDEYKAYIDLFAMRYLK